MEQHHSDSQHDGHLSSLPVDTPDTRLPDVKNKHLTLVEAAELTGVSYFTFDYSNRQAGRLPVEWDENGQRVVSAYELAKYMTQTVSRKYRWRSKWVPIDEVVLRRDLQPRENPYDPELIAKIQKLLTDGGTTTPVWLFKFGQQTILVDGYRRLAAHKRLGRTKIEAVTLRLPTKFAKVISEQANLDHGENLRVKEQCQIVRDYFDTNPTVLDLLDKARERDGKRTQLKGAISQRKVSDKLGISLSTICRVVDELRPLPVTATKIDPIKLLADIGLIITKNPPARQRPLQLKVQTVVAFRVLKVLDAKLTKRDRKNINRYLRNDQGALCQSLSPRLREFMAPGSRPSGKRGGR